MGGTTSFHASSNAEGRPLGPGKSIAISVAGPVAGFLFAFLVIVSQLAGLRPTHPLAIHTLYLLRAVNIGWGIFILLPVLPLDGGNVMRSTLVALTKTNGEKAARIVSVVVAAAIAVLAIGRREWWILLLAALFASRNVQAIAQAGQDRVDQILADAIRDAYRALDRGEPKDAIARLGPALAANVSSELRQVGVRVLVASMMRSGSLPEAMETIQRERSVIPSEDLDRYARTMRELGRGDDAERIEQLGKSIAPHSDFRA
jgi:hypothetical protein